MMATKVDLHQLVDQLPDDEVTAAKRFLEYLRDTHDDPVLRSLIEAPEDDEPLTAEDIAAIEEGKADIRAGRYLTAQEAKRQLLG